jgi:antitoxin (DNA-binding transcriptional repressor) of toxin-antitoxin stability system
MSNAATYINKAGEEVMVCKGGWKIKTSNHLAKIAAVQEDSKLRRAAAVERRMAQIKAAEDSGDSEEADYLRCIFNLPA